MTQKPKSTTKEEVIKQFDVPVTISIAATNLREAESQVMVYLKTAQIMTGNPDIIDWELTETLPNELNCCC